MDKDMKTILITGVLGLVGREASALFQDKGWKVVGIDNNMRAKMLGTNEQDQDTCLKVDIRDEQALNELFKNCRFDAIIHAAAQPSHDFSNTNVLLDFYINTLGTLNLLEATRIYSPKATFVFVSTDKVYGENMVPHKLENYLILEEKDTRYQPNGSTNSGFTEDLGLDFAGHRSPFGCSKAAADLYAQEYAHTFGMTTGIFRPGCITGEAHEGAELHGFLAYLAKCIRLEKPYKIFGFKGKQVRDQIHSKDLASAFYHFIEAPRKGEVYNIGGGPDRSVSVLEAIDLIEKETGKKAIYEFYEERPGDRQWDVHDVSKFKSHYPQWDYQYSLDQIIKDVCQKPL
jgi:CDP-paratose 2-epimerase